MARPQTPTTTDSAARLMPIITVAAVVALAAAAYFLLLAPLLSKLVAGGSLDIADERAEIAELQQYSIRLDASTAAFGKLNPEHKERVSKMVTLEPAIHDVFVQADAIAARHELVLVSVDAVVDDKGETPSGKKAVRVSANLAGGTYAQFKAFLAELETALRISDVQSVVFTSGAGSYSVTFKTYYLDGIAVTQPAPPVTP